MKQNKNKDGYKMKNDDKSSHETKVKTPSKSLNKSNSLTKINNSKISKNETSLIMKNGHNNITQISDDRFLTNISNITPISTMNDIPKESGKNFHRYSYLENLKSSPKSNKRIKSILNTIYVTIDQSKLDPIMKVFKNNLLTQECFTDRLFEFLTVSKL